MIRENLLDYIYNKHSQAGQDGILERIFNVLNIKNGYFAEFGAWDGIKNSNCRKLFEEGWGGVFIESDKKKFTDLEKNYKNISKIITLNSLVQKRGINSFDNLIKKYVPGAAFDFISIDIDGPDLKIFESIKKYLPKVVLMEGGKGPHPFDPAMPQWAISNIGQSLKIINEVAEKKGYKIICSFQDVILVKKEYAIFFNTDFNLMEFWISGYKVQPLSHIPMYLSRLRAVGRTNKILEHILKQTDYLRYDKDLKRASSKHGPTIKWGKENKEKIIYILDNLPDGLKNEYSKFPDVILNYPASFSLFFLRKAKNYLKDR